MTKQTRPSLYFIRTSVIHPSDLPVLSDHHRRVIEMNITDRGRFVTKSHFVLAFRGPFIHNGTAMPTIRAIRSSTTNGQWDRGRALKKSARRHLKNLWRTENNLFKHHAEVVEEEGADGSVATTTLGLIFWRHRSMEDQNRISK